MKPLEHFINAVLKRREADVTINMTQTSTSNTKDNIMNIDEPKKKGELKLNQSKPFTGKREGLKKFL